MRKEITHLVEILNSHPSEDEKEQQDVSFTKTSLLATPEILDKSFLKGHITGSALVINSNDGSFLLHYHKKLGRWLQFGGHPENETNPAETALREASEETGLTDLYFYPRGTEIFPIDIDVHTIPEDKGNPQHYHYDFRYILATENPDSINTAIEGESNNLRWLTLEDISSLNIKLDPALLRLIHKTVKIYKNQLQNLDDI